MPSEKQIRILKNILTVTYSVTQLFGLWPYTINNTTRRIQYNFYKLIYSIVLPCIVLHNYYAYGVSNLNFTRSKSSKLVHGKTMKLISELYAVIVVSSYALLYAGQHLKFAVSKAVYLKCVDIIELLKSFPNDIDFRKYFVNFFIKTIFFDLFNLLVLFYNLNRASNIITSHPFLPLFLYTPVMAVRIYENIFYGGVLFLDIVFKQLNKSLLKIVSIKATSDINRKNNIEKHCQLSDELDELSKLHLKLSEASKVFNSIFDVQLLLWILMQLVGLIIRIFYQYAGIVHLLNSHGTYSYVVWQNILTLVITISTWIEILLTSYACESLVTEV